MSAQIQLTLSAMCTNADQGVDVRKELSMNCIGGKVGILSATKLSLPSQELNINHMRRRKVVLIKLQRCFNVRISVSPRATSSGRRLKRLDKTASLVGLKYAFISDCRWPRRGIATALF